MKQLKQLIQKEKPAQIIAIGDVVAENMTKNYIPIQVIIVDSKVLRKTIHPIETEAQKALHVTNPPGTLTPKAWTLVQQALRQDQTTKILVDGEEDLFTLVAVSQAPENSLVVYGQPHAGLVAVKVTAETKRKVQLIIDAMQPIVEKPK